MWEVMSVTPRMSTYFPEEEDVFSEKLYKARDSFTPFIQFLLQGLADSDDPSCLYISVLSER